MTQVNSLNGINLEQLGIHSAKPKSQGKELGQQDFMKLLVTQLKNQDPLEPQENGEFIAQMAQFGVLDGVNNLNGSFSNFSDNFKSNQALQASTLVGREVLLPAETLSLEAGQKNSGEVEVPTGVSDLSIRILDAGGKPVHHEYVGAAQKGRIPFEWDGKDSGGHPLPPGDYTVEASALLGNEQTQLSTLVASKVNSVTLSPGGNVILNVANKGEVNLQDVNTIQ